VDPITLGLLVLGCSGVLILAASLIFGELLNVDVHADHADLGHDDGGPFSIPVLAAFVGAFGFVGAIGHSVAGGADNGTGIVPLAAAVVAGLAGAIPTAWLTIRLSRSLAGMPTDGTLTASALVAQTGVVVTPIGAGTFGEVQVNVGGQPLKLYAKSDRPLRLGTAVFVVEALTESSVIVEEYGSS
jgi:membrane protein implicated in regulation of membrane protease activity